MWKGGLQFGADGTARYMTRSFPQCISVPQEASEKVTLRACVRRVWGVNRPCEIGWRRWT